MSPNAGKTRIDQLLNDQRVRRANDRGKELYCAEDLLGLMTDPLSARTDWDKLKLAEPALRSRSVRVELDCQVHDMLGLPGVMRLIQSVDSVAAERLRGCLSRIGARHLEEESDPELAIQRMRQSYAARGRTRRWIDQRLRSISGRQEIVSEWYKRGIRDSEQFRVLTNELTRAAFGMNVAAFREAKGYSGNLRDHLSDLELSLLSLAETTAALLHRQRNSGTKEQLLLDIADAGRIVGQTRREIARAAMEVPTNRAA